jgi:hypothetical protein
MPHGKHVPFSHPARRSGTPPSAAEVQRMTDRLDSLALLVAGISDYPLTVPHRQRLRIIARELVRKADS